MNISFLVLKRDIQKKITRKWIAFFVPLSKRITERENEKYLKRKETIIEKQAIQWISEDLVKSIVR